MAKEHDYDWYVLAYWDGKEWVKSSWDDFDQVQEARGSMPRDCDNWYITGVKVLRGNL